MEQNHLGEESEIMLFLKSLPDTLDFPHLFGEEEMNLLEGTGFVEYLQVNVNAMLENFEALVKKSPEIGEKYTKDEYIQARLLVNSRNFGVNIKGKEQSVMGPIADMLNMDEPYNSHWGYDNDRNGLKITAITDIEKG